MRSVTTGTPNGFMYNPDQPNGGACVPVPGKPLPSRKGRVTLNKADRANARELHLLLSRDTHGRGKPARLSMKNGVARGPDGAPLVKVSLGRNKTAYVDPNTNRYYLAGRQPVFRLMPGTPLPIIARGPFKLPAAARFSNSHFSVADVRELTSLANLLRFGAPTKDAFVQA